MGTVFMLRLLLLWLTLSFMDIESRCAAANVTMQNVIRLYEYAVDYWLFNNGKCVDIA